MQVRYFREYSENLNRFMEFKMYGHSGKLCLVVPTQNNRFYEWEDQGMFVSVQKDIDAGKIQFITCDSIDPETWSNEFDSCDHWIRLHENWMNYIIYECVPSALKKANLDNDTKIMVTGASLGATHAANLFFRYPDVFDTLLALSGVYDMNSYYKDYHDELTYLNDPFAYLSQMPLDHPYIDLYNQSKIIFCVGQGAWEDETKKQLHELEDILKDRGIHAWCDYWGFDVYHDWPWWKVQLPYFLWQILKED